MQGIGGATWIELFVIYDTCGTRHDVSIHVKDPKANERAEQRNSKQQKGNENCRNEEKERQCSSGSVFE